MKKLFKKLAQQKLNNVRDELARAHLIIALLSVAVIMLLIQGSTQPIELDVNLSILGEVLLGIVALTSIFMSFALSILKNK
ncbi:hypothetical protein H7X68_01835 [Candidatus Saccharibacteria bacterium]|nr:hypothetical protein [Candidatus Saccharibacteria bacterium]